MDDTSLNPQQPCVGRNNSISENLTSRFEDTQLEDGLNSNLTQACLALKSTLFPLLNYASDRNNQKMEEWLRQGLEKREYRGEKGKRRA